MRPHAEIALRLSTEEMQAWVHQVPDKATYQRRLAIWLTHLERLAAYRVAQSLCVSTPAVWQWVRQYNRQEPQGLRRAWESGIIAEGASRPILLQLPHRFGWRVRLREFKLISRYAREEKD